MRDGASGVGGPLGVGNRRRARRLSRGWWSRFPVGRRPGLVRLHDGARVEPLCGITLALKDLMLDSGIVCEGGLWTCPGSCRGPPSQGLIFGGPVVV